MKIIELGGLTLVKHYPGFYTLDHKGTVITVFSRGIYNWYAAEAASKRVLCGAGSLRELVNVLKTKLETYEPAKQA